MLTLFVRFLKQTESEIRILEKLFIREVFTRKKRDEGIKTGQEKCDFIRN